MKLALGMWAVLVVVVGLLGDNARGEATTQGGAGLGQDPTKGEVSEFLSKEKKTERLVALVTSEYERVLKSKDWMNRGLALVCLSRLPGKEATGMILKEMEKDSVPIVRMIAWHCIAARSAALTDEEYKAFCTGTWEMVDKGMFPGEMRIGLLWWLQYQPDDSRGRKLWMKIFDETNSQLQAFYYHTWIGEDHTLEEASYEGNDRPVITMLGKVLSRWHDGELMGKVVQRLGKLDDVLRAELILQHCGPSQPASTMTWSKEGSDAMVKKAVEQYGKWWKEEQGNWKGGAEAGDWRKLRSPYVPELVCMKTADIDPDDASWRKDLELGNPNIKSVNVGFCVDATASMTAPIIRMRVDLKRLMTALSMITLEPRVSVTFYRDYGDDFLARTVMPLVGPSQIDAGIREVSKMTAKGGGDEPEAVLAGLKETAKLSWPQVVEAKKIIIIVGDAPPHDKKLYSGEKEAYAHESEDTVKLAKELAGKGFKIYTVKTVTGFEAADLSAFDEIAQAGNGRTTAVAFSGIPPHQGKEKGKWAQAAWMELQKSYKGTDVHDPYTDMLTSILTDLIEAQFKPRVEPMVRMLLAGLSVPSRAEKIAPWPKVEGNVSGRVNPQGK